MLIQLDETEIYNESSGGFIKRKNAPQSADTVPYLEFTSGKGTHYVDDKNGVIWENLVEVAKHQAIALVLSTLKER